MDHLSDKVLHSYVGLPTNIKLGRKVTKKKKFWLIVTWAIVIKLFEVVIYDFFCNKPEDFCPWQAFPPWPNICGSKNRTLP